MRDWIDITGWTLLHFVWQGALLGLAVAGVLWLCRRRAADARYAVASGGLLALLAAPVVTAAVLWQAARAPEPFGPADRTATRALGSGSTGGHALVARDSMDAVHALLAAALPGVVAIWLAGVSLLLIRMGGGVWRVHRLHEAGLAAPVSRWQEVAARLASRLGLVDPVRVVESRLVGTPTVVGWMRPIVLLPVAALANLTPAQVEAILAHELAHVRRHDYLVNLLQSLAETVLFYHPAVWWVSGRIRAEREHCCDDVALVISGDRVGYASALAALEEWRGREAAPALGAADGPLSGRVRRILDRPPRERPRSRGRLAAWAVALVLCAGIGAAVWPRRGVSDTTQAAGTSVQQNAPTPPPAAAVVGWQTSRTEHFEIRYGAALADDLNRVEAAAEGAYQRVSERLADDLPFRVPLFLFATREEFERQDIAPGANLTGIASFSEPVRNRVAVLVEEWSDDLVARISHELTHIFAFEAVPRSVSGAGVPLWIDEGLADYGMGTWSETDEGVLRGLVASGDVPAMSTVEGRAGFENPRVVYALGHAAFDFVEAEWGQEAVSAFLRAFGAAGERAAGPYQDVLGLTPAAFDAAFADYLRARFAPGPDARRP
jgi:beta-lactamase regulating signal transducer with metallopeptidase domain